MDASPNEETMLSATPAVLAKAAAERLVALHWYDLTCPFCYLGQTRTRLLQDNGWTVIELPFQAHPDVPKEGVYIGERVGAMYERIESEAAVLQMPLKWPPRLPNSRLALSVVEWVRRNRNQSFPQVQSRLFRAHFEDGLDIGDPETVLRCANEFVEQGTGLRESIASGEAFGWLGESEYLGHQVGVTATPTWLLAGKTIRGFLPETSFEPFIRTSEKAGSASR